MAQTEKTRDRSYLDRLETTLPVINKYTFMNNYIFGECPTCGNSLELEYKTLKGRKKIHFCPFCGQSITWSKKQLENNDDIPKE